MVGAEGTLGVVEGKLGMKEKWRGVEGVEAVVEVEEVEEMEQVEGLEGLEE